MSLLVSILSLVACDRLSNSEYFLMILYYWFQVKKAFNDSLTQMKRQETILPLLIE